VQSFEQPSFADATVAMTAVADDPFLAAPPAAPAHAAPQVAAPPSSMDYDDVFMIEPTAQAAPPPQAAGLSGGYEQPPFEFEMAPPPPPSAGGAQASGGGEFDLESFSAPNAAAAPPPPSAQSNFSFDYQPFAPPATPPKAPAGFGAQGGFGAPVQAQPGGYMPVELPGAPQPQGGRSELDLEIEKYQREIEAKQRKIHSAGMPPPSRPAMQEMQPYPGPGDNRHKSPYQPPVAPQPPQHSAYSEFEAELEGRSAHNSDYIEEYPSDSAMFFTTVDRNTARLKKPVKPPVNPAKMKAAQQQQPKGFAKFFNKDKQG
jgi:hypothetical protein